MIETQHSSPSKAWRSSAFAGGGKSPALGIADAAESAVRTPPAPKPAGNGSQRQGRTFTHTYSWDQLAHTSLGGRGEDVAAEYLLGLGWTILDRNWRCRHGEIDIIATDGDTLVFVEVKTRRGQGFGSGLEAITATKLARIRRLVGVWLGEHRWHGQAIRIDAVAVLKLPGFEPTITHVEGVE